MILGFRKVVLNVEIKGSKEFNGVFLPTDSFFFVNMCQDSIFSLRGKF